MPLVTVRLDVAANSETRRIERYAGGAAELRIDRLAAGDLDVAVQAPGYETAAPVRVAIRPPAIAQLRLARRRRRGDHTLVRDRIVPPEP